MTPRTLRRSRPYLINQFTRILSQLNQDISSDSDDEGGPKFGIVALNAPSRNIVRWWLAQARVVGSLEQARAPGGGEGDLKVLYADAKQLLQYCKRLGLMEDLKAGVPRTAYKGVILLRLNGRRVFLAPSYAVDQDITLGKK